MQAMRAGEEEGGHGGGDKDCGVAGGVPGPAEATSSSIPAVPQRRNLEMLTSLR
jgi:hypothetical protein